MSEAIKNSVPAARKGVSEDSEQTLSECVALALQDYFKNLGQGQQPIKLYQKVQREMELPLLNAVMLHTGNNQALTAVMLGLSRGTLRKKLKIYGLMK